HQGLDHRRKDRRDAAVRAGAGRAGREGRRALRSLALRVDERLDPQGARRAALQGELRGVPRRRGQGKSGDGCAEPLGHDVAARLGRAGDPRDDQQGPAEPDARAQGHPVAGEDPPADGVRLFAVAGWRRREMKADAAEVRLYAADKKIYPRAVHGWFAAWRWLLVWGTQLVFYSGAWLTWNGRQAVLFDIAHRKFYIFGLVFWPQDIIYLAVLLIVSALSLFLFTAVAGRLWCGYACPQTVYTEIFLWIERWVEGDRNARMRLDRQGFRAKFLRKTTKHALWIALSLW